MSRVAAFSSAFAYSAFAVGSTPGNASIADDDLTDVTLGDSAVTAATVSDALLTTVTLSDSLSV